MKIIKWIVGLAVAAVALGALGLGIARLVIDGPIAMFAGGSLGDTEFPAPADWSFADDHPTVAVEVRPEEPHSVTTISFVADNELYIPASRGPEKEWPSIAVANGQARVRIGEKIYPITLTRVERDSDAWAAAMKAATAKYPQMAERMPDGAPDDVWLFHAARR